MSRQGQGTEPLQATSECCRADGQRPAARASALSPQLGRRCCRSLVSAQRRSPPIRANRSTCRCEPAHRVGVEAMEHAIPPYFRTYRPRPRDARTRDDVGSALGSAPSAFHPAARAVHAAPVHGSTRAAHRASPCSVFDWDTVSTPPGTGVWRERTNLEIPMNTRGSRLSRSPHGPSPSAHEQSHQDQLPRALFRFPPAPAFEPQGEGVQPAPTRSSSYSHWHH